jgi:hypothetical protein
MSQHSPSSRRGGRVYRTKYRALQARKRAQSERRWGSQVGRQTNLAGQRDGFDSVSWSLPQGASLHAKPGSLPTCRRRGASRLPPPSSHRPALGRADRGGHWGHATCKSMNYLHGSVCTPSVRGGCDPPAPLYVFCFLKVR